MNTAIENASISNFPAITAMTKAPSSFIALSLLTGIDEKTLIDEVIPKVVKTGHWKKIGLSPKETTAVLTSLGYKSKNIMITLVKQNDVYQDILHTRKMEKEFIAKNAKDGKTYLVVSREHTWIIQDKKTIDPSWVVANPTASRRRLSHAFEIEHEVTEPTADQVEVLKALAA
jgi:hypothetical protein